MMIQEMALTLQEEERKAGDLGCGVEGKRRIIVAAGNLT